MTRCSHILPAFVIVFGLLGFETVTAQLVRQENNTLQLSETSPPATLSATGAFQNLATLTPNSGIVAYAPNVSFWSDYAQKSRWFCIQNLTDKVTFSADGNWTFPAGMIWIKHFDLPVERMNPDGTRRRIETRFLVKTSTGSYGLTYKWRDDQSDADLVSVDGEDALIPITVNGLATKQVWAYPSRFDCQRCHQPVAGSILSFTTRQMNTTHAYGAQTLNQIRALSDAGYFTTAVANVNNLPALAKPTDTTQSAEWRARSYFAANCAQCHRPGGGTGAFWDARATTATDLTNIINGELSYDFGYPSFRFVVPGNLNNSMAYQRILGEYPRMPPIASRELDPTAIQLLQEWIVNSLPARRSFVEWQGDFFTSSSNPLAEPSADPDRDGHSNLEEYLAYTNPTEAGSAPDLLKGSITPSGTAVQFTFTQPANRSALVESSTDTANWTLWDVPGNAPSFPASATPRTMTNPRTLETRRFFRLRLSSP